MAGAEAMTKEQKHLLKNYHENTIKAYLENLKNNGLSDGTLETHKQKIHRLINLCDIDNPEAVKKVIANAPWQNSTKQAFVQIYDSYLTFQGKTWTRPRKYKRQDKIPYIPTEGEIDTLISASRKKLSTVLQLLKETGARIGSHAHNLVRHQFRQENHLHTRRERQQRPHTTNKRQTHNHA